MAEAPTVSKRGPARIACLWALLTCLTLPSVFGVLAEFMPGIQTYVICAGDRLVTIKVGPDGAPVEAPETTFTHCVLGDAVWSQAGPSPDWSALQRSYQRLFALKLRQAPDDERLASKRLSRGPPSRLT